MSFALKSYTYSAADSAADDGPHLLVLGAIHGHEPCGTFALSRLRTELDAGVLQLAAGRLTFIPICNPLAYAAGQRYVTEDLNRIIRRYDAPMHPEQEFANQVAIAIESADVLLDLHSATTGQGASLFLDFPTADNIALATAVGIVDWIVGWPQLYRNSPEVPGRDTLLYAQQNHKRALLVECGQHAEPLAPEVAYQSIRRVMKALGLMAYTNTASNITPRVALMNKLILRDRPGHFAADWQHLQAVPAGTVLIDYDNGTKLVAETDTILILPRPYAKPGGEWLNLAESTNINMIKVLKS